MSLDVPRELVYRRIIHSRARRRASYRLYQRSLSSPNGGMDAEDATVFAEFPAVPTAPVCVPVAVVFELVVDHIEPALDGLANLEADPFPRYECPRLQ